MGGRDRVIAGSLVVGLAMSSGLAANESATAAQAQDGDTAAKIAYSDAGHLYLINPDGSDRVELTPGWGGTAWNPAISPDGRRIAFAYITGNGSEFLETIPAAPTLRRDAVRVAQPGWSPAWSPDGTRLAYEGMGGLFTVPASGGSSERLTSGADHDPTWSPDGKKVAFERLTGDGCQQLPFNNGIDFGELHTVTSDGSVETAVFDEPGTSFEGLDWSPDGLELVFSAYHYTVTYPYECDPPGPESIATMPADGSAAATVLGYPGLNPTWSPTGSRLAFGDGPRHAWTGSPSPELATMNADGTGITDLGYKGDYPDWAMVASVKGRTLTKVSVVRRLRLKVAGRVLPPVPGQQVSLSLSRRVAGSYRPVSHRTALLGRHSRFHIAFHRPPPGRCKVTAQYGGDESHRSSHSSIYFRC